MKKHILFIVLLIIYHTIHAKVNYSDNSVLASGKWVKVAASKEGIHKISYEQLSEWGISSPGNVAIYSNGGYMLPKWNNKNYPDDLTKIPVLHLKDDSNMDCVFFYSNGSVEWNYNNPTNSFTHSLNLYSDRTYFYLTSDKQASEAPATKNAMDENPEITVNTFNAYQLYEEENVNLLKTGRRWYSNTIPSSSSMQFPFNTPNIVASEPVQLTIAAAGGATDPSKYVIAVNNKNIGEHPFEAIYGSRSTEIKGIRKVENYTIPSSSSINIALSYEVEGGNANSWLDYITINYQANLKLIDAQLSFRNSIAKNHNTLAYQIQTTSNDAVIWDISNPLQPLNIAHKKNSNSIGFTDQGLTINEYLVFDPKNNKIPEVEYVEDVANQNIHGLPVYNFLIVSHPDFVEQSETLAEYHRQNDDMSVLVLTTNEIYNEFSSGLPDVSAIRNMTRMFYDRKEGNDSLRFLLLMGDGSFNNRNTSSNFSNFIPTYQSEVSEADASFVTDDYFVLLDENEGESEGLIDIGVGRIPCQTVEEAEIVVNKTINYLKPEAMGSWRNVLAFIADDEDYNVHMHYTESLINIIDKKYPGFYNDRIYFDSYTQISTSGGDLYPEATQAINRRVEEGALILNYMGHANELSLAHEDVLGINDINSWGNKNKLPVFVTATCEFSRFDDDKMTAGEQILLNPAGGGVALFSTTRVVYSSANFALSKNFYNSVFEQYDNGENFRMGDIMRMAKNNTTGQNKRNFSLLGDPALQLAFPKYNIKTKKINQVEIRDSLIITPRTLLGTTFYDSTYVLSDTVTFGALDKVSIESEVVDHAGNLLDNFNGEVTSIVYDKKFNVKTLANDGGKEFDYTTQSNIIYKGKSTVSNGKFQFSFIVPKDITYNIDFGKIYYYTTNYTEDGNGSSEDFQIGGSSKNPIIDNDPPEINLYLNNENFRTNDKVASSAILLVNLFDESGINTVGTGIGHDIVAVIDNDFNNPIVLNDYYASHLNSYQSGQVSFPINNLAPGEHTISIKAWDVQNNSAVEEISFIVEEGFEITSVINIPNPVEFDTKFEISHNLPGDVFDIKIEIFNLRGRKVYEINEAAGSYESLQATVRWDISNSYYPLTAEKMLVYRVTLENLQGLKAIGAGKLTLRNN